ncbi:YfhJ family protein [Sediminibacillus massiliensis]|uniref:YfhJ family protein n=1 Tax=Sediminibacillus massiliensis TaxID=1926277 RepID=UPI000988314A|nr:YfhJ family protein [Sediminibacillus massiliensis]
MQENINRLAERLYDKNQTLSLEEARAWVELLWEDFAATRAKAGRKYESEDVIEQVVSKWVEHYGPNLHEFLENNPEYKKMFDNQYPEH